MHRYSEWLDRLDYGNAAVGDDVERIWGDGPLEISAVEQVEFLAKLALGELPASRDAQAVTWDSNRVEKKGDAFLYAKQGRVSTRASEIAWWVGWVERGDDIAAFALNYDIKPKGSHDMRVSLGRAFLASLGLY